MVADNEVTLCINKMRHRKRNFPWDFQYIFTGLEISIEGLIAENIVINLDLDDMNITLTNRVMNLEGRVEKMEVSGKTCSGQVLSIIQNWDVRYMFFF